ncbi:lipopolysaccharide biosynthesis protein [Rhodoplanes elegans]|nr:lipopolysaccharide biosynthesis protein [Rhodoplanes elegans]
MTGRLVRNTMASATAGLSVMFGGFLSTVLVARMLGVEAAGIVAFATWVVTVSIVVADLGTPGTLSRYLPELLARGDQAQAAGVTRHLFRWPGLIATLLLIGFVGYGTAIGVGSGAVESGSARIRTDVVFWILVGVACVVQTAANYVNGYLRGAQGFARMARLALLSAVLQVVATALGGWFFGANGALAGAIAIGLLPSLLLPGILSRRGTLSPELRRRVDRFTFETWLGYVGTAFAWSRMEIFFLERSWGAESVALFSVSLTLANLATQGPLLLTGGLLPYLSEQSGVNAGEKIRDAYAIGTRLIAFLVLPACFGAAAIAPVLVPAIYGNAFAGAVPTAVLLVAGAGFSAASSVGVTYLLAMERTRFVFLTGGISAILVVVVGFTVVPAFGLLGAAVARVAIQIAVVIARVWYIHRSLKTPTPYASLARILLAASVCALAAWSCTRLIDGVAALAVAIPVGALAYGVAVRIFHALPRSDYERLERAFGVLPSAIRIPAVTVLRLLCS